jgi:branched-chain amino acid transport system permease protein
MTSGLLTRASLWHRYRFVLLAFALMALFPFAVAILDGQSPAAVLNNEIGNARFMQGLMIEIFYLALFAISYDLILGVTGLLSFGHAMFFAVGAYATGIMLKTHGWSLGPTLIVVLILAILQALLFAVVLPRVKGITFALVTLGFASVFSIIIQSTELADWTGAEVGLQGVDVPAWIDTSTQRFRFYMIALTLVVVVYVLYRALVNSPTGKVLIAIRENEDRALMLGYHTFWFKLVALIVASITAALAGMMYTLHQPIVSPAVSGLFWTVAALLMILIGGIGTLSGAIVGAATFRLLEFYLDRWFGGAASMILGIAYVAIVLFLPFGIVGTWRARRPQMKEGWDHIMERFRRAAA